jgi:hypothetical protein
MHRAGTAGRGPSIRDERLPLPPRPDPWASSAGWLKNPSRTKVLNAQTIASYLNQSGLTAADFWDTATAGDHAGAIVVPYAVTPDLVPYAYASWIGDAPPWAWTITVGSPFTFERTRTLANEASWTQFAKSNQGKAAKTSTR